MDVCGYTRVGVDGYVRLDNVQDGSSFIKSRI
jgi:hypothetical protein